MWLLGIIKVKVIDPLLCKKESRAPFLRTPWREPTGGSPVAVKGPLFTATGLSQKGKVLHQQSSIHLLSLLILHSGWQGYWSLSQLSWGEGRVTTWTSLLRYLRAICNHVRFICCFWAVCSLTCWMCQSWKHICVVLFVPVVTDLAKSFTHDLLPFFRFSETSNLPPLGWSLSAIAAFMRTF